MKAITHGKWKAAQQKSTWNAMRMAQKNGREWAPSGEWLREERRDVPFTGRPSDKRCCSNKLGPVNVQAYLTCAQRIHVAVHHANHQLYSACRGIIISKNLYSYSPTEDSPRDSVYLCRFRPPDPPPNKVSNMLQTRGTNFAKPPLSNIHLSLRASPYSRRQEVTVYGASLPSPTPECAG